MEKTYRVIIPKSAKESLRDIVEYVKRDSPVAAKKIRKRLIEIAKSLNTLPERFKREEYLSEKTGNYRSVTQWHYKIVYKIINDDVVVLQFFHTSKNPKELTKLD
jgi:toxin ParE1/3/4